MTKSVYISAAERQVSKSAIALGVLELISSRVKRVGIFRPIVHSQEHDIVATALLSARGGKQTLESALGVTYEQYANDPESAIDTIVDKYSKLSQDYDAVVVVGSDYTDIESTQELDKNAEIAANLNAPVIFVTRAGDRSPEDIARLTETAIDAIESHHIDVISIIGTQADPSGREEVAEQLRKIRDVPVSVVPFNPMLVAPTVGQQFEATGAKFWRGNRKFLESEALHTIVGAMTLANLLPYLKREATVVLPADRTEIVPGLIMAHQSPEYGPLAGLILTGGFEIPDSIERLFADSDVDLPIAITKQDTFTTAAKLQKVNSFSTSSPRKIEASRNMFASYVDAEALLAAIDLPRTEIRTPTMFEHQVMAMARSNRRAIVLPEAADDRILTAADVVLTRGVADIILLGDAGVIARRASELGLNLSSATIVNPKDEELLEKFANEYAKLRAHKNVSLEDARERLQDLSYFGTMMVHFGMADGMVSGAINTTANTIRPSLEFIKTRPGVSVVSGSFLMAMSDRVLVYADCAVNPDPTPEQLADIAISSAETAAAFGIEPRVAMLSYSTGDSGSGADVDKVREATQLVRQRAPEIQVDGPMQFDAAVDHTVAEKKMPGSPVAGRATVFIFPDLNTGNNTYKAVQRHSGAVAIGPILQGLNKAVNDLSRGALVDDIVSTITITAIQSQNL